MMMINGIKWHESYPNAVLVLLSRWPLREMFRLPHNVIALMIARSKVIFLSNISLFCVEILKWQGFLWFLRTLNLRNAGVKCPLVTLHFLMTLKCFIFTSGFFQLLEWSCNKRPFPCLTWAIYKPPARF